MLLILFTIYYISESLFFKLFLYPTSPTKKNSISSKVSTSLINQFILVEYIAYHLTNWHRYYFLVVVLCHRNVSLFLLSGDRPKHVSIIISFSISLACYTYLYWKVAKVRGMLKMLTYFNLFLLGLAFEKPKYHHSNCPGQWAYWYRMVATGIKSLW